MKRTIIFILMGLTTAVAQAKAFKCNTPEGTIYSDHQCPAVNIVESARPTPAPAQQQPALPQQISKSDIDGAKPVPIPVREAQPNR
jgi:hypothetical protein